MSSEKRRRWDKFSQSNDHAESSSDEEIEANIKRKGMADNVIGPRLPPNMLTVPSKSKLKCNEDVGSDQSEHVIGPVLPSHLQNKQSAISNISTLDVKPSIGPVLPSNLQNTQSLLGPIIPEHLQESQSEYSSFVLNAIGPVLPSHLHKAQSLVGPIIPKHIQTNHPETSVCDLSIGPVLPAHLRPGYNADTEAAVTQNSNEQHIGPALPPHLLNRTETYESNKVERILGPSLPPGFKPIGSDSESEEESFGPDPRLMHTGDLNMEEEVAARAERTRRKMLGLDDKKIVRESWMLELPPERAAIVGMGPRQFRAKPAPEMGDRSVWTDTPSDAAKKAQQPEKLDDNARMKSELIAMRDREMEKMARKAAKKAKREESLLDMHSKKLQKEAQESARKKEGQPVERKRFNREEDMQVHRFDEAQKKAIFKKAQMLDDRFSRGEGKFL